ncbi:Ig domain-containing protein [Virgisporangium aliadipatigenens]|uniref:Ig domain-containing protein n=1 Tax=Virgisporangium aliadipatigenens TaxID=741659 RepID=UPI001EF1737F|nr:Ig domain-containing protein [Virgisporangium aliadipatigenens]
MRRIDLTVELLYHGQVNGPAQSVYGRTDVWQNTTLTPLFGLGVNNPGAFCESGYYSGRATATVQYLSGSPEFITRSTGGGPVRLDCPPPDMNPPPPPVTVTSPGTQTRFLGDPVDLQMQATGASGRYNWSATGLPPGVSIVPSNGYIGGQVTTVGTYNVTVTATDVGGGGQGSVSFTIRVRREACPTC